MDTMMHDKGGTCGCMHHKFIPLLVVLFGLLFLLQAFGTVTPRTVEVGWPIIVIVAGILKMTAGKCGCCRPKM